MSFKRSKRRKMTSAAPPQLVELTLVASFPRPWKSDGEELAAIPIRKRWHPSSVDFYAVAETPNRGRPNATIVREVTDVDSFIGAITCSDLRAKTPRPNGNIGRLNIISHGSSGVLSLSGRVLANGGVPLGRGSSNPRNDERIDQTTLNWFNETEKGRAYRGLIRAKLNPGAEIWLIMCRSAGIGDSFIVARELAETFGVKVMGYSSEVWYHPDENLVCPVGDPACVGGRNMTSIGENGTKGRGYFCMVKVPDAFAGKHMNEATSYAPQNIKE